MSQQQIGWSNESKLLQTILKLLKRLTCLICDLKAAVSTPAEECVCVIVSQEEPSSPTDGLLWYKPDLCETTTTTTKVPCDSIICEPIIMTVGEVEGVNLIGYGNNGDFYFGSIFPYCDRIGCIEYETESHNLVVQTILSEGEYCYDSPIIVQIDNQEFILPRTVDYTFRAIIGNNPFPSVGETCNIRVCGIECTTTTTTEIETTTTTTLL